MLIGTCAVVIIDEYFSPHGIMDYTTTEYATAPPWLVRQFRQQQVIPTTRQEVQDTLMPINVGVRPSEWSLASTQRHHDGVYESSSSSSSDEE